MNAIPAPVLCVPSREFRINGGFYHRTIVRAVRYNPLTLPKVQTMSHTSLVRKLLTTPGRSLYRINAAIAGVQGPAIISLNDAGAARRLKGM